MKRPGYRDAIAWLADNDDNEWLNPPRGWEGEPALSVTAALVCDLFDVEQDRLIRDLRRAVEKREVPRCASI